MANISVDIGPYNPFRSLWVDGSITLPTANQLGTQLAPYKTIQQAINAVPAATTAAEMRAGPWQINIVSGTYDEDLAITLTARQFNIVCRGTVNLGTFDGAGWQPSGTRRNITITGVGTADPALGSIGPNIFITSDMVSCVNVLRGLRVSGKVDFSAVTSAASWTMFWQCVSVSSTDGTQTGDSVLGAGAFGAANVCSLFNTGCAVTGKMTGNMQLLAAPPALNIGNQYLGDLSVRLMAGGVGNTYLGNITCAVGTTSPGFLACVFTAGKTFTITAGGSFLIDGSTAYNIRGGTVLLGASTTWSIQASAANERLTFGGTIALANDKLVANGKAIDLAVAVLGPTSELAVDQATLLTKFSWNTATGNATTVVRIYKNGVSTGNTTLSGVKGTAAINIAVAAGDLISIDYASGTVPGAMTCSVST